MVNGTHLDDLNPCWVDVVFLDGPLSGWTHCYPLVGSRIVVMVDREEIAYRLRRHDNGLAYLHWGQPAYLLEKSP
jgi:hypothetical protein